MIPYHSPGLNYRWGASHTARSRAKELAGVLIKETLGQKSRRRGVYGKETKTPRVTSIKVAGVLIKNTQLLRVLRVLSGATPAGLLDLWGLSKGEILKKA